MCPLKKRRRYFVIELVESSVNSDDLTMNREISVSHIHALRQSLASNYHVSVLGRDNDATLKVRLGFTCLHV